MVEVPARLTRKQRELLREFDEARDLRAYPIYRRFMDKLKKSTGV